MSDALVNVLGYHTPLAAQVIHDMLAHYGHYERAIAHRNEAWIMELMLKDGHRLVNEIDCECHKPRRDDHRTQHYWEFVHAARAECHRFIWCLLDQSGMRKPLLVRVRTILKELEYTPSEQARLHGIAYFLRARSSEECVATCEPRVTVSLAS